MHYAGMSAFRVSGRMEWDGTFVAVSVVLGMILSSLALNRAARPTLALLANISRRSFSRSEFAACISPAWRR